MKIGEGASVCARAVCDAPVRVGARVTVAASAFVSRDLPPHGLVAGGAVRQIGWVSHSVMRLVAEKSRWRFPLTSRVYEEIGDAIREVESR